MGYDWLLNLFLVPRVECNKYAHANSKSCSWENICYNVLPFKVLYIDEFVNLDSA